MDEESLGMRLVHSTEYRLFVRLDLESQVMYVRRLPRSQPGIAKVLI